MILWNGTAAARHPAEKTELSLRLWHHHDKVGTLDAILCLSSPSSGSFPSWKWLPRVPSRATSCSACPAEWWPHSTGPLWWLVFVYCYGQSLLNQRSSQFLKLDLSLVSSIQVNSLYTLWESCGWFLYLDHHKVFLTVVSWCSWWLMLELLLFQLILELLLFVALWALYPLCIVLCWENIKYIDARWEKPEEFSCSFFPTEVSPSLKVVLSDLVFLLLFCNSPAVGCFDCAEQEDRAVHSTH